MIKNYRAGISTGITLAILVHGAAAQAQSREAMERDYVRGVIYLITAAQPAFEKPDPTSTKIDELKPTIGLLVFGTMPGWVQVELPNSATFERGWIQGDATNIIRGGQLTVPMRQVKMKGKQWPAATQLDILHGVVRIGFTKEQVEIARYAFLDESENGPLNKESEETAAGVTDTWTYFDAVYTFVQGKVSKIKKIERR